MNEIYQKARQLREEAGSIWDEHPHYPLQDWQHEVSNDYTRLGYWEWVAHKLLRQATSA